MSVGYISDDTGRKVAEARRILRELGSALVAYSGGVDSTLLLRLAHDELGDRAVPAYISSPTMVGWEKDEALAQAAEIGVAVRVVPGQELCDPDFAANTSLRCYHCRVANYPQLQRIADQEGLAAIVDGANLDDLGDYRPGRRAALEKGVRSPLLEAGLTKAEVRAASRALGLSTWDKPSMPCLASRIPYGIPVTEAALRQIERAEAALHQMGLAELRVRHHGDVARIEVPLADLPRLLEQREAVVERLKGAGYTYVTLDLQGFRSGSLNEVLASRPEEAQ